MSFRVGLLAGGDLAALAPWRARPGWELRPDGAGSFWLRVPADDEAAFRLLPLLERRSEVRPGVLVRDGRLTPDALLPGDGWLPVAELLPLEPPPRGTRGMPPPPIPVRLEPCATATEAGALCCRMEHFAAWAETAFANRLARLRFAVCEVGSALVTGDPPPAVPGTPHWLLGKLWLPCGWRLPAWIRPEVFEETLGLGSNRAAILDPGGGWDVLDVENLIPAHRASVRASWSALRS
jgi:hypothetical protein